MIDKYMGLGLLHGIFRYSENFVMDFKIYLALQIAKFIFRIKNPKYTQVHARISIFDPLLKLPQVKPQC